MPLGQLQGRRRAGEDLGGLDDMALGEQRLADDDLSVPPRGSLGSRGRTSSAARRAVGGPGHQFSPGEGDFPAGADVLAGRQRHRPAKQGGRGRQSAAVSGVVRGRLQICGQLLVGPRRKPRGARPARQRPGRGRVPGRASGARVAGRRRWPRGRPPSGSADAGTAAHCRTPRSVQPLPLRARQCPGRCPRRRQPAEPASVTGDVGRGEQHELLRVFRQLAHAAEVSLLEFSPGRDGSGKIGPGGQFVGGEMVPTSTIASGLRSVPVTTRSTTAASSGTPAIERNRSAAASSGSPPNRWWEAAPTPAARAHRRG